MTDAHCHAAAPGATRRFICPLPSPVHFTEMHPREALSWAHFREMRNLSSVGAFPRNAQPVPRGRISAKCAGDGDIVFWGVHPWFLDGPLTVDAVRAHLLDDPRAGVGEIGLDRLRDREIPDRMREIFAAQLRLAVEFRRPVVLHGAKCWGQVVATIRSVLGAGFEDVGRRTSDAGGGIRPSPSTPPLLFHGFSRSDGLLPDIVRLNGYVSVGPAVLNDHAVNYRALVKKIPADRLLLETDATAETAGSVPALADIAAKVAELRGVAPDDLAAALEANASAFVSCLPPRVSCLTPPVLAGGQET